MSSNFVPGTLIRARGRDWVVQPESTDKALSLRPLGGSDEDIQVIIPYLERMPVELATFPPPDPASPGAYDSAVLLRDALRLKLRSGAGPFRSFGKIAVEPRAYQLVPLLMALKQQVVRLLIADDVGIGKTIEAALIAREFVDRGEITRFAVLCPPHLVDQWVQELSDRFHFSAVAVSASSVSRLERETPPGVSLFTHFPYVVISLDYIKSERHVNQFLANAPELILVDEAHTCTVAGLAKQRRWELLEKLSNDPERHMIMLTATPHSGNDQAFHNLLSLLDRRFAGLMSGTVRSDDPLRRKLAEHFVQRKRIDIGEWKDSSVFPTRKIKEVTYSLTGEWARFFDDVRSYCQSLATNAEARKHHASPIIWYATLALLRCASSSPASAVSALTKKLQGDDASLVAEEEDASLEDGDTSEADFSDTEPAVALDDDPVLLSLIKKAEMLRGASGDPKLVALVHQVESLLSEGFRPVVFCRYIATAEYVAENLRSRFPKASVDAVTGLYTPEERKVRVDQLFLAPSAILVATDCLSEGVNLQHGFNAVLHYDLAWNPTRHEQREGRVDRFGQKSKEVRCIMLYGQDNPVDGFILNVILRKAQAIKGELGILVPLPEDRSRMRLAMVKSALMRQGNQTYSQSEFLFDEPMAPIESAWRDAVEKAKANRSLFSQQRIKPSEVMPEWERQAESLGGSEDVRRFTETVLTRAGSPLEPVSKESFKLVLSGLPAILKERFAGLGIRQQVRIGFSLPTESTSAFIHRSNPIVGLLADAVLENALGDFPAQGSGIPLASRAAAFETKSVSTLTRIYLVRVRHQLSYDKDTGTKRHLLAEESIAVGIQGIHNPHILQGKEAERLLDAHPSANISTEAMRRALKDALDWYGNNRSVFDKFALERANTLLNDHRRVRDASAARGQYSVKPSLPVDLIGMYVLLPSDL